jgi:hypothetical protein
MESLRELINIVNKNKISKVELIGHSTNNQSKVQTLYEGIYSGKFKDDEAAALFFYEADENLPKYKKLKYRLEQRLINSIFFIDLNQPSFNEIQKAYYACYKDFAAIKILTGKGAKRSATALAEKTLRQAIKFEFSDIIVQLSRFLRLHFGSIIGDKAKYNRYNDLVNRYSEILLAELKAEEYYSTLAVNYTKSKSRKLDTLDLAIQFSEELKAYTDKFYSYNLYLHAYLVYTMRYQIDNDLKNIIEVCTQAVQSFEAHPHTASKVAIFNFKIRTLACYIQLKQFEKGEEVVKSCLELVQEGNLNWFATLEYYFILCLHTRNFEKAIQIFSQASQHKRFKMLYQSPTEDWRIYEAYLNYLNSIGKIEGHASQMRTFKLGKFLNEVPTFSKDKRGMNINILIIQILFLLQKKDFGTIIDRMEAIDAYCYRYLRKDDTFRSNCFIKMLLLLPKASFHKGRVVHRSKKYLEKLQSVPLSGGQGSEIEIIPYEMLWEFVIESLEDRIHHF